MHHHVVLGIKPGAFYLLIKHCTLTYNPSPLSLYKQGNRDSFAFF